MEDTVQKILTNGKGVLALDWSPTTIAKKFLEVNLVSTSELNRVFRQILVTTPNLNNFISGIILHNETINQKLDDGQSFVDFINSLGIVVGVRADQGSEKFTNGNEDMSIGLDGLDERLKEYSNMGIKFSKWRAGFKITDLYPSKEFLDESVNRLVEFAKISHKNNLVPFVEPDIEMSGNHTTTRCDEIATEILKMLFEKLNEANVDLTKVILKTSMVLPGIASGVVAEPLEVAHATLRALRKSVPKDVGGIVFLSGGQSYDDAVEYLDKIKDLSKDDPWKISFSFARALEEDSLHVWKGEENNINEAQNVLLTRLEKVCLAQKGEL